MKEKIPHPEFAAGVVVFHLDPNGVRTWLTVKNAAGHWELPKGHANPGEHWIQTALRELAEETGITDIALIPGFSRQIRYVFRDRHKGIIRRVVHFAMGRTSHAHIRLSDEHTNFAFLPIDQAIAQLTHAATRAVLRDAHTFMQSHLSIGKGVC